MYPALCAWYSWVAICLTELNISVSVSDFWGQLGNASACMQELYWVTASHFHSTTKGKPGTFTCMHTHTPLGASLFFDWSSTMLGRRQNFWICIVSGHGQSKALWLCMLHVLQQCWFVSCLRFESSLGYGSALSTLESLSLLQIMGMLLNKYLERSCLWMLAPRLGKKNLCIISYHLYVCIYVWVSYMHKSM